MRPYERSAAYYETDQMGIVHHSNYIRWFEEARIDYMEQMGISYAKMEKAGVLIPVLGVTCEYKAMVRFSERFQIHVALLEFNGIRMKLGYEVRDCNSQELRCTGETSHCFLNNQYRPLSLKKSFPGWYEIFLNEMKSDKE